MPQTIPPGGARLAVDQTATDEGVDFVVPGADIVSISTSFRAGRATDEGDITINNDDWAYTTEGTEISIGDKLVFLAKPPVNGPTGTAERPGFGTGSFGSGPFGEYRRVGTYQVLDWDIIEHSPTGADLALKVGDFVYSTLQNRTVFYRARDKPLSGSSDAILNEVLAQNCPEIDRTALPDIQQTADYFSSGKSARKVVDELATYAADLDGPVVQTSEGTALVLSRIGDLDPWYEETLDGSQDLFGPWATASQSDQLVNDVRIDGGTDSEENIDDEQTTVDGYYRVTNSDRLVVRCLTRKSELTKIQLWTKGESTSEDGLRVRLQVDDGGAPIAPGDTNSDIVSSGSQKVALDDDGWRTFELGDHDIPERNPWMIVDSEGDTGHRVGVDANNVPAYKAHFPKPVAAQLSDYASRDQYGHHEKHIKNDNLTTSEAARSRAQAILDRQAAPDTKLGPLTATSPMAHRLRTGDTLWVDRPEMRAVGKFLVTERSCTYEGTTLSTDISLQGAETYA